MMQAYSYEELLNKVESIYNLKAENFSKITGIPADMITEGPDKFQEMTADELNIAKKRQMEMNHIATMLSFFIVPFEGTEDDYLRAHMMLLMERFGISKEAIARFTSVEIETIDGFLQNKELPDAVKYQLAVRFFGLEWLVTKNPYIDY